MDFERRDSLLCEVERGSKCSKIINNRNRMQYIFFEIDCAFEYKIQGYRGSEQRFHKVDVFNL